MTTKQKLLECLLNIGVIIDETDKDVDLREYIIDSIQFITAIVEIEQCFSIHFPDELLLYNTFESLNGLVYIIDSMLSNNRTISIIN